MQNSARSRVGTVRCIINLAPSVAHSRRSLSGFVRTLPFGRYRGFGFERNVPLPRRLKSAVCSKKFRHLLKIDAKARGIVTQDYLNLSAVLCRNVCKFKCGDFTVIANRFKSRRLSSSALHFIITALPVRTNAAVLKPPASIISPFSLFVYIPFWDITPLTDMSAEPCTRTTS